MRIKNLVISILSFLALFFIVLTPQSLAMEPSVIWQGKLTNKSMVMDGVTTSKNETLLASYTTKKDENQYEIFKVNNKTSKVTNLSKLTGGEIHFFDFQGKGYVVHREKRAVTIYDENFRSVYKKATWKSGIRLYGFYILKSKVDPNLLAIRDNVYNFNTKKYETADILLNFDRKDKLVEVSEKSLPGEDYLLSFSFGEKGLELDGITEQTVIGSSTKFHIKPDLSTVPNFSNGYRNSFSSSALTKYKDHFYFILRENERGLGAEILLKVNNKGKVVDYLELPGSVSSSPEPTFISGQLILSTYTQEGSSYHFVNLDDFSMQISSGSQHLVFNDNLYYIYKDQEYQFFNKRNQHLYTLPALIYTSENGKYGIDTQKNPASATIYDLNSGTTLVALKTDQIASFDDTILAVEQISGHAQVKLYKLK